MTTPTTCPDCGSSRVRAYEVVILERLYEAEHDEWVTDDADVAGDIAWRCDNCGTARGLVAVRSSAMGASALRLFAPDAFL